jgi:hypothetical protein
VEPIKRRTFLAGVAAGTGAAALRPAAAAAEPPPRPRAGRSSFEPFERASCHPIVRERPAVNFFEGALLGNGGLGVVVTTRPDAVVLRFGHNDVWDIRVAEEHADEARRPPHWRSRAARSASSATKGDNDLVFLNLQAARLENFALPVVVNECLLQGNDGTLRLFPNWPTSRAAEFRTLRAAGGFLVSAAIRDGAVLWVELTSEAGAPLAIELPWAAVCERAGGRVSLPAGLARLETRAGETLGFRPRG